jgi:3'5'-cyclic nucleotide phosphodiesterase
VKVDHPGVPNSTLVKEEDKLAERYNGKSIAEQHSVTIAWDLFLHADYTAFRAALCSTPADMIRFRQIVVNLVMATDVMDPDLKDLRNSRWTTAFNESDAKPTEQVNRKATIVLEHLIQASDVAHTMQHWQIYRKWNECLYLEMRKAYQLGRSDKDPSIGWYQVGWEWTCGRGHCRIFSVFSPTAAPDPISIGRDWLL